MRLSSLAVLCSATFTSAAFAQAPAAPASTNTVGFMHAIHATNDVDKTLAFYTEVFGLNGKIMPFENPGVPLLTNSPGVKLRVSMLQLPGQGFNFELTEFTNTTRNPAQPQSIADPGAPHMKLLVRDLAPVVKALAARHTPIITQSGKPLTIDTVVGKVPAIVFRDPDGYLVQALQVQAPADAPAGNVVGSIMGLTVEDLDQSLKFWNGTLGVDLKGDTKFRTNADELDVLGLPKTAGVRTVSGMIPGSNARIELMDTTVAGKAFDLRVPDPGASGMALRVAAIDKLLPHLKSEGVRVLSKDGALVEWSDTVRNVFVKDPNGLNLELVGIVGK